MTDQELALLRAEAARIESSPLLERSQPLQHLFRLLIERSTDRQRLTESEIAAILFERGAWGEPANDGAVRVAIHRLRRKLAEYYANRPEEMWRLHLPKGEYRLLVIPGDPSPPSAPDDASPPTPAEASPRHRMSPWLAAGGAALLMLLLVCGAGLAGWLDRVLLPRNPLVSTAMWRPLASDSAPVTLVTGDYLLIGEFSGDGELQRLVREFHVNLPADIAQSQPPIPGNVYRNVYTRYLPITSANAITALSAVTRASDFATREIRVIPLSRLTPSIIQDSHLVYVGYVSGLGALLNPTFAGSAFEVGNSFDELVERKSGRQYRFQDEDGSVANGQGRDYVYLSTYPGPTGKRIVIVAGLRDFGLAAAGDIATDPELLDQIAKGVDNSGAFEALFEITGQGPLRARYRLIRADRLDPRQIWNASGWSKLSFPDRPAR